MSVLLEAKNIVKRFSGVPALSDGNLTCKTGRIVGLLGANGSGKSTINKCITGVYKKNGGTVTYEGKEVNFHNPMDAKKAGISMAFQNLSLLPDLNVWQNIVMGFEDRKGGLLDNRSAKKKSQEILDNFIPGFNMNRKIFELSPSEMQIVEIAKAIYVNPKLLILDEPTAALEQSQVKALFDYMRRLKEQGVAMVFTSHRMWEVMEICDEVAIFKNGENSGYMDFDTDERDAEYVIKAITGRETAVSEPRRYKDLPDDFIIEAEDIHYARAVRGVDFRIRRGEVLGIGGLSGQGQEELLLTIAGNYPDAKGKVTFKGKKLHFNAPFNTIKDGIVLVPGDRQAQGLLMTKSIYYNGVLPRTGLKKEPTLIPNRQYREDCTAAQEVLSTKYDRIDQPVSDLSGGNAQKVVLSKWLNVDMDLLILSDPAKGVDVGAKKDLYDFVQKLADEKGIAVLVYASDNEELIDNCDRVLVMYEGKVVKELVREEITNEALVKYAMLGHGNAQVKEGSADE